MFIKKRKRVVFTRVVAMTLLITTINQIFTPTVVFALTSGPTVPEATSFEPIDTTDMVNPLTGDFTYNLPLLEVPGPEGGYPLSLSYHAGIQPNEDASWVGLGWNVNPGAITRSVNGFPDDWSSSNSSRRDYWDGGKQVTYTVGASIGLTGASSASFGLSFSHDTYQGFGVGMSFGMEFGLKKSPYKLSGSFTVSPFGGSSATVGLGRTEPGGTTGFGIGVTTNFESISADINGGNSSLRASMSTDNVSPSFSVGGISATISNDKAGNITTSSSGFSFGIPITPIFTINLGYKKTRYWSDETISISSHGSLHANVGYGNSNHAYDSYALLDPSEKLSSSPDPNKVQGGAHPDFDLYSVSAQGLSGDIRPYDFQGEVRSQNRSIEGVSEIEYFSPLSDVKLGNLPEPYFRFINDFSNSYRQNDLSSSNPNADLKSTMPSFDTNPQYGNNDGAFGYGQGNKIVGSKAIKYHAVDPSGEIYDNADFMIPKVAGLERSLHAGASGYHIAGFSITNSSGVTYHYNLPAYSYGEEIYQAKINGIFQYNRQTKDEGYAYTWHLTSITGPDYVDRNGNRKLDEGDWGYWVNFEYGKWVNDFAWRNPSEGFHKDEDNEFQTVSMGKKEIYYLNAIRTRSHVALFEKDARSDGRGASPNIFDKGQKDSYVYPNGLFDNNSARTMRLDKIYLLNASDANIINETSSGSPGYQNVLDRADVNTFGRSLLESKAIRIIDFGFTYDLCKGTENSFNSIGENKSGKLTLNSVIFRGVGGANLTPPMEFEYGLSGDKIKKASGTFSSLPNPSLKRFTTGFSGLEVGDLLETDETSPLYGGVISAKEGSGGTYNYTVKNCRIPTGGSTLQLRTTKNPPYDKDAFDMWGMFKSDYLKSGNENFDRSTSAISGTSADVWSLRRIKTSLGSVIEVSYEGDTYTKSILNNRMSFIIDDFQRIGEEIWELDVETLGQDLTQLFKTYDPVSFLAFQKARESTLLSPIFDIVNPEQEYGDGPIPYVVNVTADKLTVKVKYNVDRFMLGLRDPDYEYQLMTGNLNISGLGNSYGGGIRVKSLSVDDLTNVKYETNYVYNKTGTNLSSGVTSYLPVGLEVDDVAQYGAVAKQFYRNFLYDKMDKLYQIAREVPPPGVMYEYVSIENQTSGNGQPIKKINGKSVYQHEVFRSNMVGRADLNTIQTGTANGKAQRIRNLGLKKFVASLGSLKRITRYNDNGKKISETINNYLHDGLEDLPWADFMSQYELRLNRFNYQGVLKERYSEVKERRESNGSYVVNSTLSSRVELPVIPLGQTTKDYVTGISTGNENVAFDFYSGGLTKMVTVDAYGNRFMSVTEPAYRSYPSMGLKGKNSSNRNMLSQESANTTYKVNSVNEYIGVISATASTWGNNIRVDDEDGNVTTVGQSSIWRPKSTFIWAKTGTSANNITPVSQFTAFNFTGANGTPWLKNSEITRYNVYSSALEAMDLNMFFASTKLGYQNRKVVVTSAPARYHEIAYAGAEDPLLVNGRLSTNVVLGSGGVISNSMAHTGNKSISTAPNTTGLTYQVPFSELEPSRIDYLASVWVKSSGDISKARLFYRIDDQPIQDNVPTFQKIAAGWYLLEMRIPASALSAGTNLTIGCRNAAGGGTVYFDDFRVQPFNSPTNSFVYNMHTGELTHILDNNNLYTKYEYDAIGRLVKVYKEVLGKTTVPLVKEISYNLAKPIASVF